MPMQYAWSKTKNLPRMLTNFLGLILLQSVLAVKVTILLTEFMSNDPV